MDVEGPPRRNAPSLFASEVRSTIWTSLARCVGAWTPWASLLPCDDTFETKMRIKEETRSNEQEEKEGETASKRND